MNHSLHRCKERYRLLPSIITSSPSHVHILSLSLCCVFQADALHSEASEETMSHPLRWLKCLIWSELPALPTTNKTKYQQRHTVSNAFTWNTHAYTQAVHLNIHHLHPHTALHLTGPEPPHLCLSISFCLWTFNSRFFQGWIALAGFFFVPFIVLFIFIAPKNLHVHIVLFWMVSFLFKSLLHLLIGLCDIQKNKSMHLHASHIFLRNETILKVIR